MSDDPVGWSFCPTCDVYRPTYVRGGDEHCAVCHSNLGSVR